MKKSSVSRMRRLTYFQILCYALERGIRTQHEILFGEKSWVGSRVHHNTEFWTQLMVRRWNSSGIFSQDAPHCSSAAKSKCPCLKWAIHQNLMDESSSGRCSMTSNGDLKTIRGKRRFHQVVCHSSDLDQKWYSTCIDRPQGEWDSVAELMMIQVGEKRTPSFPCHESTVPMDA